MKHKKKYGKPLWIILAALLILGTPPLVPAQAAIGEGEIAFNMTPNADITMYSFTDVSVGASSTGYSAVNMSYPTQLRINYNGTALSAANKPQNWTITISDGAGDTTNVSIMIAAPAINGKNTDIERFLNSCSFTLKEAVTYPPDGASVTVMISEQTIVQFTDIEGIVHAYEFVEFAQQADKSRLTWLEAYNAARRRSYFGQQGYLATLTSIEEQMFVYSTIAQKPGWLGGTTLRHNSAGNPMIDGSTDISTDIRDYTYSRNVANAWYWADGPEAGTVFYNRAVRDDTNGPIHDVFNFFSNGWTYNNYPQYRNQIQNGNEPNGDGGEYCLQFAWANKASWNDLPNNSSIVQGYYVEYDFPEGFIPSYGMATAQLLIPIIVAFHVGNSHYTDIIANQAVREGGTATMPAALEIGYLYTEYGNMQFLGWFEELPDIAPFDFSTPLTETNTRGNIKNLYGKWLQYHNVSFDINNSSYIGEIPMQTVLSGANAVLPLGIKNGVVYGAWNGQQFGNKEFLGWFRQGQSPESDTPFDFDTDTIDSDMVLQAHWKQHYTVTFNVDNAAYSGFPITAQSVPEESRARTPDELMESIVYEAYGNKKFLGWYDGEVRFDFSTPITSDTTLTARWEQYYTVTFANVKDRVAPAQTVAAGGFAVEPETSDWDILPFFTFHGWSSNSTDKDYSNFNQYDFYKPVYTDTIAYGMWDPSIFSLVFDPNGGNWNENIIPQMRQYCPGADNPPWEDYDPSHIPVSPERHGYRFDGWMDENGSAPLGYPAVVDENKVYYAQWVLEEYQIFYELHAGTLPSGNPALYTVEDSVFPIYIDDPEREGYTFLGWMVQYSSLSRLPDSGPIMGFSVLQGVTGDIRLEALWNEGNEYAIYYDLDGGAAKPENPYNYTVEKVAPIIAPIKQGHTFLGWTAAGGMTITTPEPNLQIPLGTMGDIYLKAHWQINSGDDGNDQTPSQPNQPPIITPPIDNPGDKSPPSDTQVTDSQPDSGLSDAEPPEKTLPAKTREKNPEPPQDNFIGTDDFSSPPIPNPGGILIPGEDGKYIEIDEDGNYRGYWYWDEESGMWIFKECLTFADSPQTADAGYPVKAVLLLGIFLIGTGIVNLRKRKI